MLEKLIKYLDVAGEEQTGTIKRIFERHNINWIEVHRPINTGSYFIDYIQSEQIIEG